MNKGSIYALIFLAGGCCGAVGAWKMLEKKYRDIADEEIASVKEYYERKIDDINAEKKDDSFIFESAGVDTAQSEDSVGHGELVKRETEKESLGDTYKRLISKRGYRDYSGNGRHEIEEKAGEEDNKDDDDGSGIYAITGEELGEEGYDVIEFTYYEKDNIVADENDEEVENYVDLIGSAIDRLKDGDDTVVYVRNDILQCDYEILLSINSYNPKIIRSYDEDE
ncbi:MAG: hypothetical protein IJS94_07605 [Clostridia bacterium]|nr:hypothetical protein [Clostridia bacterium]